MDSELCARHQQYILRTRVLYYICASIRGCDCTALASTASVEVVTIRLQSKAQLQGCVCKRQTNITRP
jgi:hypothetical protein